MRLRPFAASSVSFHRDCLLQGHRNEFSYQLSRFDFIDPHFPIESGRSYLIAFGVESDGENTSFMSGQSCNPIPTFDVVEMHVASGTAHCDPPGVRAKR